MSFQVLTMVVREKRDVYIRSVHLKFGVALAISVGGILYTFLRIRANKAKPSQRSPGHGDQAESRGEGGELRDDDMALLDSSLGKVYSHNSISSSVGDKDSLLLPEFNELVKECNVALATDDASPKKNGEYKCGERRNDQEKEFRELQNQEIQLLDYYGTEEQESVVMELSNKLRLHNTEAKIYNLKIESLLSHNKRLEAQVADYARVVQELEAEKARTKLLRKKLLSEAEQNKEKILTLQDRLMKMQDQEDKAVVEMDQDVDRKELEGELEEMKKSNQALKQENSDLLQKLEYLQMLATSALDNEEVQELKEESRCLRQRNEDLAKEIEEIQGERWTDLEELVYLRWINACLRYELRNYHPSAGKTISRDISKTLSPKSEEKAKQLILEHAYKEGSVDKRMGITDFDSDHCSSSQASCLTESGERDDLFVDALPADKPNQSSKTKVFAKLRKLLTGKGSPPRSLTPKSTLQRAVSVDNISRTNSSYFHSGSSVSSVDDMMVKSLRGSSGCSSRRSFDLQRTCSRSQKGINTGESCNGSLRSSDVGSSTTLTRIDSLTEEDDTDWSPGTRPHHDAKDELLKYAEALKNARAKSFRRRPASFESRL